MNRISATIILGASLCISVPSITMAQNTKTEDAIEQFKRQEAERKAGEARHDSLKVEAQKQQAFYDAQNKKTQRYIWIVVAGGLLFSAVFFFSKNRSTIMSIVRIFTGGFRTQGDVTTPESKKILTGAMYADQQGAFLNTLTADIGGKLHTILRNWWGINDRDTAVETLNYLQNKGFSYYFPTVYKAFQSGNDDAIKAIILEAMTAQEDVEKAFLQTYNLLASVNKLKELKIISHTADIEKYGAVGWDAGRLIFIARLCYDAKYITEEEAWEYVDAAYAQAQSVFNSWEEIAKSYIIGRFLWKGKDADDGMNTIAENLIKKDDSPWKKVAWK
jgi:hypothetical protein